MQAHGSATAELRNLLTNTAEFARLHPEQFPSNHSINSAAVAHANLQALRDSGDANFLFTRCVVELSAQWLAGPPLAPQDEELLFHCITGSRHVLLTKWNSRSGPFRVAIRDYFMSLGMQHIVQSMESTQSAGSRTIRLAFLNASASFWKRSWEEDATNKPLAHTADTTAGETAIIDFIRQQSTPQLQTPIMNAPCDLFAYLKVAFQKQQPEYATAATTFLHILLGEFAGKSSSEYNMPLEFHKRAHASFGLGGIGSEDDETPMNLCLQLTVQCLGQLVLPSLFSHSPQQKHYTLALSVIRFAVDVIGWDWGTDAWDATATTTTLHGGRVLVKPPTAWRAALMQSDLYQALFQLHTQLVRAYSVSKSSASSNMTAEQEQLLPAVRQLLLQLFSLSGPVFQSSDERKHYCEIALTGVSQFLTIPGIANPPSHPNNNNNNNNVDALLLIDTFTMIHRLCVNYKLSVLVQMPTLLSNLLQHMTTIGRQLLQDHLQELQSAAGDIELMEHGELREEALSLLIDGIVMLCDDPWLLHGGTEESRQGTRAALANALGSFYNDVVTCRTQMARLEEMYATAHEVDLDEVREDIYAVNLEEEMTALANVGRLDLGASLTCLSGLFQQLVPQLTSLWEGHGGTITPEAAGLLEESRLVTMYVGHLLTDDNEGESPAIPDAVIFVCERGGDSVTQTIVGAVQTLLQFAHFQVTKIATQPTDTRLSPLLAQSFLWFLHRWAPAYILPLDYGASPSSSSIFKAWSSPEAVRETVSFLTTLCLHYHCYWPQERQVQEHTTKLLFAMTKRCARMRHAIMESGSFQQLLTYHCLTAGIRHSASPEEIENTVRSQVGHTTIAYDMLRGYQRLPYAIKSQVVTALLVGCSEYGHELSRNRFNDCLKAIHDAFSALVHALSSKQAAPDDVNTKEMACLCVELYGGVARSGEMVASERIPKFLTPSLPHLSGLMSFYAQDLSICEALLRLFRDYAEQFIAVLDTESCLALFQACGELLRSYSSVHCSSSRVVVHSAEEEQSYNDILCVIQLLIQLGTKDFINVGETGMDSSQVTDMIFFGLQQILPLMTRGLLQYPTLCSQYFSLVGFMMETYPEKSSVLPTELFDSLLESLLFGMSHHDTSVAKCSLQGLAGIIKEHLTKQVLNVHLNKNPTILDKCTQRILLEVVFQNTVFDRLEATGLVVLYLAASDLGRFGAVVQGIVVEQRIVPEQVPRLMRSFEQLLQGDVLAKVTSSGYEGRQNRIQFKKDFDNFCHEIHSYLVLK